MNICCVGLGKYGGNKMDTMCLIKHLFDFFFCLTFFPFEGSVENLCYSLFNRVVTFKCITC